MEKYNRANGYTHDADVIYGDTDSVRGAAAAVWGMVGWGGGTILRLLICWAVRPASLAHPLPRVWLLCGAAAGHGVLWRGRHRRRDAAGAGGGRGGQQGLHQAHQA